jgi:hypothetical protein
VTRRMRALYVARSVRDTLWELAITVVCLGV